MMQHDKARERDDPSERREDDETPWVRAPGRRTLTGQLVAPSQPLTLRRKPSLAPAAATEPCRSFESQMFGGEALPAPLQDRFEQSLGLDLSQVRLHTGAASAEAAQAAGARAYAVGSDIHFGAGEYDPDSRGGQELLAHEVAHTAQQSGAGQASAQLKLVASEPGDAAEVEADRAALAMVAGQPATVRAAPLQLARKVAAAPSTPPPTSALAASPPSFVEVAPRVIAPEEAAAFLTHFSTKAPPPDFQGSSPAFDAYLDLRPAIAQAQAKHKAVMSALGHHLPPATTSAKQRSAVAGIASGHSSVDVLASQSRGQINQAEGRAVELAQNLQTAAHELNAAQAGLQQALSLKQVESDEREIGALRESVSKIKGHKAEHPAFFDVVGHLLKAISKAKDGKKFEAAGEMMQIGGVGSIADIAYQVMMGPELRQSEIELDRLLQKQKSDAAHELTSHETQLFEEVQAKLSTVSSTVIALVNNRTAIEDAHRTMGRAVTSATAPTLGSKADLGRYIQAVPQLRAVLPLLAELADARLHALDDPATQSVADGQAFADWMIGHLPGLDDAATALQAYYQSLLEEGQHMMQLAAPTPSRDL